MASLEQAERFGGFTLLGIPVFDAAAWILDNYTRVELLVRLREVLPTFLLNPVFTFVCLCTGIFLLDRAYKEQIKRLAEQPSGLIGVDSFRKARRNGLLRPSLITCLAVVLITPLLALTYSLAYKGTPPLEARVASPPPSLICKTDDCFAPKKAMLKVARPSITNSPNCPNGVCAGHDVNGPITVNPPVNPNARVKAYDCAGSWRSSGPGLDGTFLDIATCLPDKCEKIAVFDKMVELNNSAIRLEGIARTAKCLELRTTCSREIKDTPEWLTPHLFCGMADSCMNDLSKLREELEYYDEHTGPSYGGQCKKMADFLHAQLSMRP